MINNRKNFEIKINIYIFLSLFITICSQNGNRKTIAVIGGGVTGLSTAWHLGKTGKYDVTLFDRETIGTFTQASSINSGFLHTEPKPKPDELVKL